MPVPVPVTKGAPAEPESAVVKLINGLPEAIPVAIALHIVMK
jgi:hypothetical protein